jgi:hypothetical protein
MHVFSLRTDDERGLDVKGTPAEMLMYGDPGSPAAVENNVEAVDFGGLEIVSATTGAKHDGKPAISFILADSMGDRPVGRLVLLDIDEWREEIPEFTLWFSEKDDRIRFIKRLEAAKRRPKVSKIEIDFSYVGDLEHEIALTAAKHGVSIRVVNPNGPAGGCPVVEVSGLTENVEKALRATDYGWGLDDDDLEMYLG